ncbi:transporter substrate-binding domain-containing protein [Vibrio sp. S4M6]|uniref:substrate-binding periplasmic protein n=1 Tax=Vibrio sinus TaxID=2946865 RepID=UPI00202A07FF|nr:transporter substrate-binding domain-containing protein [Vibrio sinus]MCL9783262.1 transporter substrate-binding domain-containing protein [Vibrio sinus]
MIYRISLSLLFLFCLGLQAKPLIFATGDWRPYIFEKDDTVDDNRPGFSIEIVDRAFEQMGYQITYKTPPFSRQILDTERGVYTALVGLLVSDAPNLIYPTESIGQVSNCFYAQNDNGWKFKEVSSLVAVKLGVISSYTYGVIDDYVAKNHSGNVIAISGSEENILKRLFRMLEAGRIDVVVEDRSVVSHYLENAGLVGQFKVVGCLGTVPAMIGFSPVLPESKELARQFSQEVQELRRSGELQQILNKYGIEDWKSKSP